jgi:hypothetical protein
VPAGEMATLSLPNTTLTGELTICPSVGEIMYTRAPSGATDDSVGSFDDSETAIGANAKSRLSTANLISVFMVFISVITLYE